MGVAGWLGWRGNRPGKSKLSRSWEDLIKGRFQQGLARAQTCVVKDDDEGEGPSMSQGNEGNEGGLQRVSAPKRDSEALVILRGVFSGSAGNNNEGGAGMLESLRQLQIQHCNTQLKRRSIWTTSLPWQHPL
jgi:hypothetical protein